MNDQPPYYQLRDLLQRPELLHPPPVVLPRLAWQGRLTLLAAPEKTGKSTLLGQGVAAKSEGAEFLGDPTEQGVTLWLALDEPLGDVVRRLAEFGATDGVVISTERPAGASELRKIIETEGVEVVVIDTLTEFAADIVAEFGKAPNWQPLLRDLRGVMQETGAACVLSHHSNRATGRYRDSSQIGAGVDAILEMFTVQDDVTARKVEAKGRMRMDPFRLRYAAERYELDEGELPLEMRIYRVIEAQPGIALGRLRKAVTGKSGDIDRTVADLIRAGTVADQGVPPTHAYVTRKLEHVIGAGASQGKGRGKGAENLVSGDGQTGSSQGQGPGQPPFAPALYTESAGQGYQGADRSSDSEQADRLACSLHPGVLQRRRRDGTTRCPICVPNSPRNPYVEPVEIPA